jgi:hypothetical protein
MKKITCLVLTLSLCVGSVSFSFAGEGVHRSDANAGLQLLDGFIVRPVGVGLSLVTSVIYAGTFPLTFLMDVDEQAGDALVSKPWGFTSGRELGDF